MDTEIRKHTRKQKKKRGVPPVVWAAALLLFLLLGAYGGQRAAAFHASSEPSPAPAAPTPSPEPTATPAPAPVFTTGGGYIYCRDGMFYPESPLTLAQAAEILRSAGRDVEDYAEGGSTPMTEEMLLRFAADASTEEIAAAALESIRYLGDETVTRAEAAVFFNRLFNLAPTERELVYFPDVAPDYWAFAEIQTAAESGYCWPGEDGHLEEGFMMLDGYLYLADADGYLRKNCTVRSLKFDHTGRYTSGSPELDGYVAEMLRQVTNDSMSREEMLEAAYLHIRDGFSYLIRHYYRIGDTGWPLSEALTMYSTGKGNCYCYSGALWAAARQLGYDAKIVSGTYGEEGAPHGWVEIYQEDGTRLTYDVEIEMVMRAENGKGTMFALPEIIRAAHGYVEQVIKDNLIPRETNDGLLPR